MKDPRGQQQGVSASTWRAWTAGWMMGVGIGIIALFVALQLPFDFYSRMKTPLFLTGFAFFAVGCFLLRQSKILSAIFAFGWHRREH